MTLVIQIAMGVILGITIVAMLGTWHHRTRSIYPNPHVKEFWMAILHLAVVIGLLFGGMVVFGIANWLLGV